MKELVDFIKTSLEGVDFKDYKAKINKFIAEKGIKISEEELEQVIYDNIPALGVIDIELNKLREGGNFPQSSYEYTSAVNQIISENNLAEKLTSDEKFFIADSPTRQHYFNNDNGIVESYIESKKPQVKLTEQEQNERELANNPAAQKVVKAAERGREQVNSPENIARAEDIRSNPQRVKEVNGEALVTIDAYKEFELNELDLVSYDNSRVIAKSNMVDDDTIATLKNRIKKYFDEKHNGTENYEDLDQKLLDDMGPAAADGLMKTAEIMTEQTTPEGAKKAAENLFSGENPDIQETIDYFMENGSANAQKMKEAFNSAESPKEFSATMEHLVAAKENLLRAYRYEHDMQEFSEYLQTQPNISANKMMGKYQEGLSVTDIQQLAGEYLSSVTVEEKDLLKELNTQRNQRRISPIAVETIRAIRDADISDGVSLQEALSQNPNMPDIDRFLQNQLGDGQTASAIVSRNMGENFEQVVSRTEPAEKSPKSKETKDMAEINREQTGNSEDFQKAIDAINTSASSQSNWITTDEYRGGGNIDGRLDIHLVVTEEPLGDREPVRFLGADDKSSLVEYIERNNLELSTIEVEQLNSYVSDLYEDFANSYIASRKELAINNNYIPTSTDETKLKYQQQLSEMKSTAIESLNLSYYPNNVIDAGGLVLEDLIPNTVEDNPAAQKALGSIPHIPTHEEKMAAAQAELEAKTAEAQAAYDAAQKAAAEARGEQASDNEPAVTANRDFSQFANMVEERISGGITTEEIQEIKDAGFNLQINQVKGTNDDYIDMLDENGISISPVGPTYVPLAKDVKSEKGGRGQE